MDRDLSYTVRLNTRVGRYWRGRDQRIDYTIGTTERRDNCSQERPQDFCKEVNAPLPPEAKKI